MDDWLLLLTRPTVAVIDLMALAVIAFGTFEAFVSAVRLALKPKGGGYRFNDVWLRYGRWLVAGLTFQLASDIIETSTAPGWEEIGRLAAIAVIRTFLNFFLERDIAEAGESESSMDSRKIDPQKG